MVKRSIPGWFVFLLLTGLVTGQLVFLFSGGPDRVLARSLIEDTIWVQVGFEVDSAPSDGLLTEPPPLPTPVSQSDSVELDPGQSGELALGTIPVAFGENAPLDVPERAGLPRASAKRDSGHRRMKAFDRDPRRVPLPPPVHPGKSGHPEKLDAYRKTLLAIYCLEQKGGELALTPAQARQMLDFVSGMEVVKGAVPEARRVFLEVLTPEQVELLQARRVARGGASKPLPPEEIDREIQNALKELGE